MKHFNCCTYLVLAVLLFASNVVYAQIDLFNKKESLKDFNYKTLVVVLENNSIVDLALKDAIEKEWQLSKYKFCNLDEFEQLKGDTSYYFLTRVKGIFKKEREPAIEFLSLLKGGPKEVKGVDQMADILSMPLQDIDDTQGAIIPYISAYVKIFQAHVLRIQKKKIAAHLGISWYANRLGEIKGKRVLINENDLSRQVTEAGEMVSLETAVSIVGEDEIYKAIDNKEPKTIVTLVISPTIEQQGSFCYKMLLSTDSNELFYYKKQKISSKTPTGLLKEDIRAIVFPFK
ncbi:MAG: hypothetical protein RSC28_03340 [Bacteroidales bacterium]